MHRLFVFSFAGLVLTLSNAWAVPARPRFEPVEQPLAPLFRDYRSELSGTAWLGKYSTTQFIFILESDGTLSYETMAANAKTYKNRGSWKFEGGTLYFEFFSTPARKLMEFRGTVTNLNSINGESIMSITGVKSQQTLQRTKLKLN